MYKWLSIWTLVIILSCYIVFVETQKYDADIMFEDVDNVSLQVEEHSIDIQTLKQYIDEHSDEFETHKEQIIIAQNQCILLQQTIRSLEERVMLASKAGAFIVPPIENIEPKDIIENK